MFAKNRTVLKYLGVVAIVVLAIFIASTHLQQTSRPTESNQANRTILIENNETALSITPQPNGNLCPSNREAEFSWEDMIANPPVSSGLGYQKSALYSHA